MFSTSRRRVHATWIAMAVLGCTAVVFGAIEFSKPPTSAPHEGERDAETIQSMASPERAGSALVAREPHDLKQSGGAVLGESSYPSATLAVRAQSSSIVARVRIETVETARYNTSDGLAPAGNITSTIPGWVTVRPMTARVIDVYKSDGQPAAGLVSFDWGAPVNSPGMSLMHEFGFAPAMEGVILLSNFDAHIETEPLVAYLQSLESTVPFQPARSGTVLDWFEIDGGMTHGYLFNESIPLTTLIAAVSQP